MVSKKAIIGIVVVIVIIAVAAIALGGGSSEDKPDIRYDYEASFETSLGDNEFNVPSEGNVFLVVDFAIANDTDVEVSTNLLDAVWTATLDGVEYSSSIYSFSAPGYQLIDIQPGAVGTSVVVFKVPEGHAIEDFEISLDYQWNFDVETWEHDDSLL